MEKDLKNIAKFYFLGIGGIGMSGLARYFKQTGKSVVGYDKTATEITAGLVSFGIDVNFADTVEAIPEGYTDPKETLVVYTPAIPKNSVQLNYFREGGFTLMKRAEVLGMVTRDTYCFAVAGTHGKTTTTSILAHLLKETGTPITAFLGGVSENFNSNFLMEGTDYTVVEADEFDRSFLHLSPDIACVTSMDADHLDIYGDKSALEASFREFTKRLKPGGKLFVKSGLPLEGITYGLEDESDYNIQDIQLSNSTYLFTVRTPVGIIQDVTFSKPGRHNLLNALAAFAMAAELGAPHSRLAEALATFKGIKRRFSYHINREDLVYIDDYAHHPSEIDAVCEAVRSAHPGKKVLAVFQPHLFSRTRDFADEFAESLSGFDALVMLEIYPARELPIPGVTADWLLEKVKLKDKRLLEKAALPEYLKQAEAEVILTIGAGDIGVEVERIKKVLNS
ncbi:UDP-N-acetylmuramate--L-alanine ligase [Robertkochia solimangrovi]|uniref:UDP-N-acetylmuramate--L-alanine ligase n=1 Tax=Robertkochia solimangrovi TaxID=2213046 RepID=UPI0011803EE6|nr:UDP-N-acetylmuramate--L-alanine ligase [Robertkochia solimangrovi]TRZ44357.1 UDP-N-acetylmuramate--L-alanine ligase [Robertkochia solimangrovi]